MYLILFQQRLCFYCETLSCAVKSKDDLKLTKFFSANRFLKSIAVSLKIAFNFQVIDRFCYAGLHLLVAAKIHLLKIQRADVSSKPYENHQKSIVHKLTKKSRRTRTSDMEKLLKLLKISMFTFTENCELKTFQCGHTNVENRQRCLFGPSRLGIRKKFCDG